MRRPLSLRSQLYLWLLLPMLLVIAASSALAYRSAVEAARTVADRMLLGSARMIGEAIASEDGRLRAELPPAALENLQTGAGDRVYYRVDGAAEGLLTGFPGFARLQRALRPEQWAAFEAEVRGEPVRALAFAQPVYPFDAGSVAVVQVATTLRAHEALVWRTWLRSLWPQALLLAAVALFGRLWVGAALAPVTRIGAQVRSRAPGERAPLPLHEAPRELQPLVRAINEHIERIGRHVAEHGRFISNAAHQLKTPIAVLNTQLAVGLRSEAGAPQQHALQASWRTVQHCGRLTHQLLTLSAADHTLAPAAAPTPVALRELAREVLEDLASPAYAKRIDLGLAGAEAPCTVHGVPLLLREMLANLVDNAIRYTPEGGTVTLALHGGAGGVRIEVEDSGPGIAAAERERVFERFYRLPDTAHIDGSGLGLAIVREIALASGAQVSLHDRPDGAPGLLVRVSWPL